MGEVVPWLTPGGVLLWLGWLVVRGSLIPRRTHLDRIEDYKATIEDKNKTIAELRLQLSIMLGFSPDPPSTDGGNGSNGATPTPRSNAYGQRRRGSGRRGS